MIQHFAGFYKDYNGIFREFSVESIGDIAYTMMNKKNLKKIHMAMLMTGILRPPRFLCGSGRREREKNNFISRIYISHFYNGALFFMAINGKICSGF